MKLHIFSDLHLKDVEDFRVPDTDAEVVILAGDVARPARACAWARQLRKPVIYVAGNHEFYHSSIEGTLRELKGLCAGTSVHMLDADELIIGGVRFLGTTLWTDFMIFGEGEPRSKAMAEAQTHFPDFSSIRADTVSERMFSPDDATALFRRAAVWLRKKLNEPFDGSTVVVTHHAPSLRSIHPQFDGSLLNACFVSDAQYLLGGDQACLWVHGHIHSSFDYVANGTRVVCNPRGYARRGVNENATFDPGFVVVV
jgi:Icc-related predicted phosphoesterase